MYHSTSYGISLFNFSTLTLKTKLITNIPHSLAAQLLNLRANCADAAWVFSFKCGEFWNEVEFQGESGGLILFMFIRSLRDTN